MTNNKKDEQKFRPADVWVILWYHECLNQILMVTKIYGNPSNANLTVLLQAKDCISSSKLVGYIIWEPWTCVQFYESIQY